MLILTALTNILSSRFTKAYNVQLVAMGGPFVTSLLSSCLIGEVLPWTLWPALLVAAVGQVLFVAAQAGLFDSTDAGGAAAFDDIDDEFQDEEQNGGYRLMRRFLLSSSRNGTGEDGGEGVGAPTEVGLTGYDWLGIGLQFVSLFFSAGARVVMKTSADVIKNPADLMAAQYLFCAVPSLLYSSLLAMPPPPQSSSSSSSSSSLSSPADPQPSPSSSPLPPHDAFDALDDGGNDGEVIRRLLRGEESHLPPEKAAVGSVWLAWGSLTAADWGMFVLLAVGVVTVAATVQVHCIRVLGPSGHTALQPLRLVFTVAASALLLYHGDDIHRSPSLDCTNSMNTTDPSGLPPSPFLSFSSFSSSLLSCASAVCGQASAAAITTGMVTASDSSPSPGGMIPSSPSPALVPSRITSPE